MHFSNPPVVFITNYIIGII